MHGRNTLILNEEAVIQILEKHLNADVFEADEQISIVGTDIETLQVTFEAKGEE